MHISILFTTFISACTFTVPVQGVPLSMNRISASLAVRNNEDVSLYPRGSQGSPSPPPVQHAAEIVKPIQQRHECIVLVKKPDGYVNLTPEQKTEKLHAIIQSIQEVTVESPDREFARMTAIFFGFRGLYTTEEIDKLKKQQNIVASVTVCGTVCPMSTSPSTQNTKDTVASTRSNSLSSQSHGPDLGVHDNPHSTDHPTDNSSTKSKSNTVVTVQAPLVNTGSKPQVK